MTQLPHPLPLDLLPYEPIPFTNSFLWAPPAHFCFLFISYDSHRLITSFFGASSACLLSLEPFIILWVYEPLFLSFWPNGLYFAGFFLHLFHIVGLLLPFGPFVKNNRHEHLAPWAYELLLWFICELKKKKISFLFFHFLFIFLLRFFWIVGLALFSFLLWIVLSLRIPQFSSYSKTQPLLY